MMLYFLLHYFIDSVLMTKKFGTEYVVIIMVIKMTVINDG